VSDQVSRTWDGQPIATEDPTGSSVIVRRRNRTGDVEVLLLHRAHEGPDYAGDWAWTSPAGARQPGEPVYSAALRELAEEAGISGQRLWPVDLSGRWAVFVTDVAADIEIDLVDPEHDRWEWVSPEEASTRVLPAQVSGSQFSRVGDLHVAGVTFQPLETADLADVVRWQQAPHAREWFDGGPVDVEAAQQRYAARLRGESATRMWRVDIEGRPAGYLQAYRVSAYEDYALKTRDPDAVAFDYVIGAPDLAHRGWGRTMIWAFVCDVLCNEYPETPRFLASPDHRNRKSLRALEACGFEQGLWIDVPADGGRAANTEIVCTFNRRHWLG
jgi:8-oxo-dGTP pyrophosphatase MutT (NUDIX family)/RimJ/RimL family protein N-acetyltransferase